MCKEAESSPVRDKYHEILRELRSIKYTLNVLEQAANNGMSPQQYQNKQTMEMIRQQEENSRKERV